MFYSVVMETSQEEDTTPTSLVNLPSVDSELEHRDKCYSVNGDSEVVLLEKQKASLTTYRNISSYRDIL